MDTTTIIAEIAARLRGARGRANLSGREVQERGGPHQVTLSRYESGSQFPTLQSVYKLAQIYGIRVADILPDWQDVNFSGKNLEKSETN